MGSAFIVHESSCLRLLGGGPAASYWERRTAAMEPPTEAKDDPMNWLLLKPIRPFITLAALASLLLNLALVLLYGSGDQIPSMPVTSLCM